MIEIDEKKKCCGCTACYNICRNNAINMEEDEEGFIYPVIDKNKCIKCSLCEKVCPIINKKEKKEETNVEVIAAWNKQDEVRKNSSSGGIFYALATHIIKNDGIVCAAGYDEQCNVIHKVAETEQLLKELQGSKYVQSNMKQCFKEIEAFLNQGRPVLFVGTPCQNAGLCGFLRKEYNNLYLCDIICHGVPSPKVYRKYIEELEKQYNSKVKKVGFRDKENGWKNYQIIVNFENGESYKEKASKNIYIRGFLKNLYLRPSCHECKFSGFDRCSDITLGDFWGIDEMYPELDDNKGVSLLLINSKKGKTLLEECATVKKISVDKDKEQIVKHNPCIVKSAIPNKNRRKFFSKIGKENMQTLCKKYINDNLKDKLREVKKKIVRK